MGATRRRQFVAGASSLLGLLVSGCQGLLPSDASDETPPTEESTRTATQPDVADLEESCIRSEFEGYVSTTPVPPPTRPDDLTSETGRTYVVEYERYYQRYRALYEIDAPTPENPNVSAHGFPEVRLDNLNSEVANQVGGGYIITVVYELQYQYEQPDGFRSEGEFTVTYFVSKNTTVRAGASGESDPAPDPLTDGTVMTC